MTNNHKYATFFGNSFETEDYPNYQDTIKIGKLLAESGYTVKNGGYSGLMTAVSKGAKEAGGEVIGYTCQIFPSVKGNEYLTQTVITTNIFERLFLLMDESELFVIQIGSYGTLSEAFLLMDLIKASNIKPVIFFIGDMWSEIFDVLREHLIMSMNDNNIFFCKDYIAFEINILMLKNK
jgi:hypothetical protein